MTCEQAIQYIHSHKTHKTKPGLERISALLQAMGNPQHTVHCIHVAGTNGKGSVCAMLDSILRAADYRVGLFTSPYIRTFHERMRADGKEITDGELAEITDYVRSFVEQQPEELNEFELITAIGFEFFRRRGVKYVILEVGLGGRLDPTNIIEDPILSIITDIDFDHTVQLGNTLQAIAAEKAGIIKNGRPCLFGGKDSSACRTIRSIAALRHAPFHTVDRTIYSATEMTLDGTVFNFQNYIGLHLPLLGAYQPFNTAIVLTALTILEQNGLTGTEEALRRGLEQVRWPARFELLSRDPVVIFDGAHNPQGIAAAVQSINTYFPEQKVNVLAGVMEDKGYDEMVERLRPIANRVYTVTPDNPRALPAADLAAHFEGHRIPAEPFNSVREGVHAAMNRSKLENIPLICLGSLYLYDELRTAVEE